MLSTVSSVPLELNTSCYTTVTGNNSLDVLSVIESENGTAALYMLPAYIRTTSMVVCIVVMVLGIIGNLMVPIVVFRGKDMRNSTNIFLVNLSVADLCVLLICIPTILVEVNSGPQVWPLGEHMWTRHFLLDPPDIWGTVAANAIDISTVSSFFSPPNVPGMYAEYSAGI
ncbi:Neuropeptide Y receptor type 1 [Eufriesea mexicana]|uniref:Neuropeptide Y receptor type 1 n=1 Tax=Eufriesea mexicana TaxID=516756 RepID=A0A310SCW0_9HYME|nr:Neuropeptide Y receptor type 1 [Eufriesea mexicana]